MCLNDCLCYHSVINQANITDCTDTSLMEIPKILDENTDWFIAAGNDFGDIDTAYSYFEEVRVFKLSSNNIKSITSDAITGMLKNTRLIDLGNNSLKYLPKAISSDRNRSVSFFISGNPYECNCDMLWMRDWLLTDGTVFDTPYIKCGNGKMKGNYLASC